VSRRTSPEERARDDWEPAIKASVLRGRCTARHYIPFLSRLRLALIRRGMESASLSGPSFSSSLCGAPAGSFDILLKGLRFDRVGDGGGLGEVGESAWKTDLV
jgi:hypothetical protein